MHIHWRTGLSVGLLALSTAASQAGTADGGLSKLRPEVRVANARDNLVCRSLGATDVQTILRVPLAEAGTVSPTTNWCRFTLSDKRWFEVSALRMGKVGEIAPDCYDEQNSPTEYKRIFHPHCFAVTNGWQLRVQADQRPSIPKTEMKKLLEKSLQHLGPAFQQPPHTLFGGKA